MPGTHLGAALWSSQRFMPPFRVRARMKAASSPGAVSALFTYTDPLDGNPHNENDFEFPSGTFSRTRLLTNHFGPSVTSSFGSSAWERLTFDAATSFNEYSIEVYKNKTTWLLNNKIIRVLEYRENPSPQRVVVNSWFTTNWWNDFSDAKLSTNGSDFIVNWIEVVGLPG